MNRTEHLLSCLAEECCEIGQRVSKALRFGLDEVQPGQGLTNGQRIIEEYNDLRGVMQMLEDEGILDSSTDYHTLSATMQAKKAKVEKFMRYAAEQGALQGEGTQS